MADKVLTTNVINARPNLTIDGWVSRRAGSEFLRSHGFPVAVATLASLVTRGGGPPYHKFGKRVLYNRAALLKWAEARLSKPRLNSSEAVFSRSRDGEVAQ